MQKNKILLLTLLFLTPVETFAGFTSNNSISPVANVYYSNQVVNFSADFDGLGGDQGAMFLLRPNDSSADIVIGCIDISAAVPVTLNATSTVPADGKLYKLVLEGHGVSDCSDGVLDSLDAVPQGLTVWWFNSLLPSSTSTPYSATTTSMDNGALDAFLGILMFVLGMAIAMWINRRQIEA